MYDRYRVKAEFRDRIVGGMPKNKEMVEAWVRASRPKDEPVDEAKTTELVKEDLDLILQEEIEKVTCGFAEDENGFFIPVRQVKAMLKQSASLLGVTRKKLGSKQILAEGCVIKAAGPDQSRIYLGKTVSGTEEKAIHAMTPKGKISALRRFDYFTKPVLEFEIWILTTAAADKRHIGEADLIEILTHAQENGLGASRSQEEGKFDIVEFTCLSTGRRLHLSGDEKPQKKGKPDEAAA